MTSVPVICIVDDAADYRLLVQHLFAHQFPAYSVLSYATGRAFLNGLPELNQLPSLILLDRHMPGLDGYQTLVCLKEHPVYKKIPVVMMSADASETDVCDSYEAYANSFLRKPIQFDLLKDQLTVVCQYWLEFNRQPVCSLA